MKTLRLFVKPHVLDLFRRGKDLEIRISCPLTRQIEEGDELSFNYTFSRMVLAIRTYPSFEEMLDNEDLERIAPGYERGVILRELQRIYGKQERQGVLVFELTTPPVKKGRFLYAHPGAD